MQIMHRRTQLLAAVGAHVHTHAYRHKHAYRRKHCWDVLNEYVCPAEGQRRKMNWSVVFTHCFAASSSQSRMK